MDKEVFSAAIANEWLGTFSVTDLLAGLRLACRMDHRTACNRIAHELHKRNELPAKYVTLLR